MVEAGKADVVLKRGMTEDRNGKPAYTDIVDTVAATTALQADRPIELPLRAQAQHGASHND